MIAKLTGTLSDKTPPQVLVACQCIGYEVHLPRCTFYSLAQLGGPGEPSHALCRARRRAYSVRICDCSRTRGRSPTHQDFERRAAYHLVGALGYECGGVGTSRDTARGRATGQGPGHRQEIRQALATRTQGQAWPAMPRPKFCRPYGRWVAATRKPSCPNGGEGTDADRHQKRLYFCSAPNAWR